jgi:hypothetical protein
LSKLRALRTEPGSSSTISSYLKGKEKEKKAMARRKLTLTEQLRGIRSAIKSKKTPPQLKPGLEKRKDALEKPLGIERKTTKKRALFSW